MLLTSGLHARAQEPEEKEEAFEKVDPYTRGEPAALERAGYVSLGPFEWAEGIRTDDVRETLGGIDVLWVETAHFKIGSTLRAYKPRGDPKEDDKLEAELAELKKRLEKFKPPRNKIDPWLRLHLYALRLEKTYAEFCKTFAIRDSDFPEDKGRADASGLTLGDGPYLGMERKFAVLLAEKESALGRYSKRYSNREERAWDWFHMPGGTLYLGISAEGLRELGYELDTALHCTVAGETMRMLIGGFRESWYMTPMWFGYGLAHVTARNVDERFTPAAGSAATGQDEDTWKWEPRVRGLVENKAAVSWKAMAAWDEWEEIKTQGHLVAWSRASWLATRKPAEMRAFLIAITDSLPPGTEEEQRKARLERQDGAAKAAFGKGFDELDAEWRKFVVKKYSKR